MNGAKKKAGRPRAVDERMSAEAFDALMKLARLSPKGEGNRAAKLVLVDGMSREEAVAAANSTDSALCNALWRYRKLREFAKIAAQSGNNN